MKRASLGWLAPAVFVGSAIPFCVLAARGVTHRLGANPIETALNQLGLLALVLLVASLSCTPARLLFAWSWAAKIRRTLGLMAFAAATAHFGVYVLLSQGGDLGALWQDVTKRPFIFFGFAALLALVPLAATSTKRSVKRLGSRRWVRLHRLAYAAGILAIVHFFYRVKADLFEPAAYGLVLGFLLLVRLVDWQRRRSLKRRRAVRVQ